MAGLGWAHLFMLAKWLKMYRKVEALKRSEALKGATQALARKMSPSGVEYGAVQHFDRRSRLGRVGWGRPHRETNEHADRFNQGSPSGQLPLLAHWS